MRKFNVQFYFGGEVAHSVVIGIEQSVIDGVDDEWRSVFYSDIKTEKDIATFLAHNIAVDGLSLSRIDGFADCNDSQVKILKHDDLLYFEDIDVEELL